jgi:hypothetical protein
VRARSVDGPHAKLLFEIQQFDVVDFSLVIKKNLTFSTVEHYFSLVLLCVEILFPL